MNADKSGGDDHTTDAGGTKEVRVLVRIKNNRMLERREALGLTQPKMADVIGMYRSRYSDLENLKRSPVEGGEWTRDALQVAEYYDCDPEELFPESVLAIKQSSVVRKMDVADLAPLALSSHSVRMLTPPDESMLREELEKHVQDSMKLLKPREMDLLVKYHGFEDEPQTLRQIGKESSHGSTSVNRQAQIKRSAEWKMRKMVYGGYIRDNPLPMSAFVSPKPDDVEEVAREARKEAARIKQSATRERHLREQPVFTRVVDILDGYPYVLDVLRDVWTLGRNFPSDVLEVRMRAKVSSTSLNKINLEVLLPSRFEGEDRRKFVNNLDRNVNGYATRIRLIHGEYDAPPIRSRSPATKLVEDARVGGFAVLSNRGGVVCLELDDVPDHRGQIMDMRLWFGGRADLEGVEGRRISWRPRVEKKS